MTFDTFIKKGIVAFKKRIENTKQQMQKYILKLID